MNYYPWNAQAFISWMNQEAESKHGLRPVAAAMGIPYHRLQAWSIEPMPRITLQDVYAIARYRGWTLPQTLQWLEISSAHFDDLLQENLEQV